MSALPGTEARALVAGRAATAWRVDGMGPLLVLVHSAGGNARSFDAMLPHLEGRAVLVPSFPGRLGSEGPHPRTAEAAAAWLRGFLLALDVPRAIVAGHSVGGAIAIELALAQARGEARPLLDGVALVSTGARLRVLPEVLRALESAEARGEAADLSSWLAPDPARRFTPPAAALEDWRMADGFDRLAAIGAVRARTLVLSGTADPLTPPKYGAFLRDRIPGAQLLSFEGAGHDLPLERPAEVAAALVRFADTAV